MALICEIGTIVPSAESYCSTADCDTYHLNRNNTAWIGTTAIKEAALRNATAYIDGKYRSRWLGYRVSTDQSLEWPRYSVPVLGGGVGIYGGFLLSTTIPQRLKDAVCEAALRALSGALSIDADTSIQSKKIDVLETTYRPGAIPGQQAYQIIDQLISDYLKPLGSCDVVRC